MFSFELQTSQENDVGYVTCFGGVVVVRLRGELDLATGGALRDLLSASDSPSASTVLVDLSRVSFIDASSIGQIVVTCGAARERGVLFGVEGLAGQPARVFDALGLRWLLLCRTSAVRQKGVSG